jgi:predicted nucleotidyltransferase
MIFALLLMVGCALLCNAQCNAASQLGQAPRPADGRPAASPGSNLDGQWRAQGVFRVHDVDDRDTSVIDTPDSLAADKARSFARALAPRWQAQLGDNLRGAYLLGSLAHGGFSRRYSDIDLGVVTGNGLDAAALEAMRAEAAAVSPELAPKVSIFWTDRRFALGRFPPLDRADYLDHAIALVEAERVVPPRPLLDEVRAYLGSGPFANWATAAQQFAQAQSLDPKDRKSYLRAHLYPARFVMSFMTGAMASNDRAVEYVSRQALPGLDTDLIARALDIRRAADDPDALFPERRLLLRQVAACAALVTDSEAERP